MLGEIVRESAERGSPANDQAAVHNIATKVVWLTMTEIRSDLGPMGYQGLSGGATSKILKGLSGGVSSVQLHEFCESQPQGHQISTGQHCKVGIYLNAL